MSAAGWTEEAVAKRHNRAAFDCGEPALDEFLQRHARQTHEAGGAKVFVAVDNSDTTLVLGFYALSPASIAFPVVPATVTRGLARHDVPVFRLGRLAVSKAHQSKGLGGQLLLAACRRCIRASQEVGGVALLIDAKNERVANWYAGYGALRLEDTPLCSAGQRLRLPRLIVHPSNTSTKRRSSPTTNATLSVWRRTATSARNTLTTSSSEAA